MTRVDEFLEINLIIAAWSTVAQEIVSPSNDSLFQIFWRSRFRAVFKVNPA